MSLLSTIGAIGAIANGLSNFSNTIGNLASGNYAAILSGLGSWANGMQVATWRGIPFAVKESTVTKGRRVAEHVYPFRDTIWAEDMGRGVRRYTFRGFLVGDDVLSQSGRMQGAVEQSGPGVLIHPALGALTCACKTGAFRQTLAGRVVEIDFEFVETSQSLFPSILSATQNLLGDAADNLFSAIAGDFQANILTPLSYGIHVAQAVTSTIFGWASIATTLIGDVSMLSRSVSGIVGNYGRYNGSGMASLPPATASTVSLLAASTTARTTVFSAVAAAAALPGGASVAAEASSLAAGVAAVTEAIRAAAQAPADQVRLLTGLTSYAASVAPSAAPIGGAIVTADAATAALCRRSALASLAKACGNYLPSSSQDAVSVITDVTGLFDAEMLIAADGGDLATWQAFRSCRAALVSDMTARAAQLPAQRTVTTRVAMPSLVLAYQLYQDSTRSDDLIRRVDPVHPAFMPTEFEALSA